MRLIALLFALVMLSLPARADMPTLTVYTYESFVSEWGPGKAITDAFQADCGCKLEFVSVEDAAGLLSRLKLEGDRTSADIVLGLDTSLTQEAAATGLLAPHGLDLSPLRLPMAWHDPLFVPLDYGFFAFVYDKTKVKNPPASFEELARSNLKIVIQDPRTSTPGLGLLLWIKALYGAEASAMWQRLKPHIVTVTRGWSEAYGLFLKGEADMVLSYTTSPAYHRIAEEDDRYEAALFEEGNYMQVEVAAMLARSKQPELARKFLAFMLTPGFQGAIPTGNWMYPTIALADGLPQGFDAPLAGDRVLSLGPDQVAEGRKAWIAEWLATFAD
jgi:thiamine transport system substrate-binding protein